MAEFGFGADAPESTGGGPAVAPPPLGVPGRADRGGVYELRPLSLGEILDRTFGVFRRGFWTYVGIASIGAGVLALGQMIRLAFFGSSSFQATAAKPGVAGAQVAGSLAVAGVAAVLYLLVYGVLMGATIAAVAARYRGRPASLGLALRSVRGRWGRYILVTLWQMGSVLWVPMLLLVPGMVLLGLKITALTWLAVTLLLLAGLGFLYGVYAYLRNALAMPAAVVEDLKLRAAMRRSKALADGSKRRLAAVLLMLYVLSLVGGALELPFAILLTTTHGGARIFSEGVAILVGFAVNSLIAPLGAIAYYLVYVDARVRKEGYDLEELLEQARPVAAVA